MQLNYFLVYLRCYGSTISLLFSCCVQLFVIPWTAAGQAPRPKKADELYFKKKNKKQVFCRKH